MIEWMFSVYPGHAAINPARKCRCVKKAGKTIGQPYTRDEYDAAKEKMHRDAELSMHKDESIPVYPSGAVHVEIVTRGANVHRKGPAVGLAFIDADAVTKCVLDAISGVAYADDSQVVRVVSSKTTDGPIGIRVRVYTPGEQP
jgi:Holliday junction resolvase RusA-like endonuclease